MFTSSGIQQEILPLNAISYVLVIFIRPLRRAKERNLPGRAVFLPTCNKVQVAERTEIMCGQSSPSDCQNIVVS